MNARRRRLQFHCLAPTARSRANKARELLRRHGEWRVFDPYQTVNHGASTVVYCSVDRDPKTMRRIKAETIYCLLGVLREALPGSADGLRPNKAGISISLGGHRLVRIIVTERDPPPPPLSSGFTSGVLLQAWAGKPSIPPLLGPRAALALTKRTGGGGGVAVAPRQLGPPLLLVATSSGTLGPFSSATEAIQTRGRLCPCSDQGPGPIVVAIQDASNSFYMFPPRVGGASTADWRSAGGLAITFI